MEFRGHAQEAAGRVGVLGQELDGDPYTPSPVTIGMKGPVNQGNLTITMKKGTGANLNAGRQVPPQQIPLGLQPQ